MTASTGATGYVTLETTGVDTPVAARELRVTPELSSYVDRIAVGALHDDPELVDRLGFDAVLLELAEQPVTVRDACCFDLDRARHSWLLSFLHRIR